MTTNHKLRVLCASITTLAALAAPVLAQTPSGTAAQAASADIAKTLGFVPDFFKAFPEASLPGVWEEMKGLQLNPNSALGGRTKELIGLAVASQIPCRYCTYAHVEFAKLNGAGESELGEAVAIAGMERHFSAYFYGLQLDEATFKRDLARLSAAGNRPAAPAVAVVDGETALKDIANTLGFVPDFLRVIPASALPGVWREWKEIKLSPNTKLSAKDKALISLAVAAQVPSHACIVAETEFARLAKASDREIAEAVGMAAITRNMSTLLNGQQVSETKFRADVDRLVAGVKAAQKKAQLAKSATH